VNILAVDCSTDVLMVALSREDAVPTNPGKSKHPYRDDLGHAQVSGIVSVEIDAGYRHAERIMGAVEYCLAEAGIEREELDLLSCGSGPGSFTGLRIAMSTVKGLALALGKPFVGVPTLDAMARDWEGTCPAVVPVLDAKRARFFFGVYAGGRKMAGPFDDGLSRIVEMTDAYPEVLFTGTDASMLEDFIQCRSGFRIARGHRRMPARAFLEMAGEKFGLSGPADEDSSPLYLRPSDAEEQVRG